MSLSWWILLPLGVFTTLLGFVILLSVIGVVPMEHPGWLQYLEAALLAALFVPYGVALVCTPLITRVIVRSQGIEYHTLNYVLKAEWKEVLNSGYFHVPNTGKTLVVIPNGGLLAVRKWTRPFWSLFRSDPRHVELFVSLFGSCDGHKLEDDIMVNVPHA